MIKINLICMGYIKEKYWQDAIEEYVKRLSRFCTLNIVQIEENVNQNIALGLQKDMKKISPHLKGYVIVLDVLGKPVSSPQFAKKLNEIAIHQSEISFVIGASNGLDERLKASADERISFSALTFPHQLMRVIFLEQLYRAFMINAGAEYHK